MSKPGTLTRVSEAADEEEDNDRSPCGLSTKDQDNLGPLRADDVFDDLHIDGRVLVIYTGGTIGMTPSPRGYCEKKGFLEGLLYQIAQTHDQSLPRTRHILPISSFEKRIMYDVKEYDPLLDSCNMKHENYIQIAEDIYQNFYDYDGFVILHGTDTMAYTASYLSFIFRNLSKPVILTGSQIPLCRSYSDGLQNFVGAMMIAGHFQIPEVSIFFANRLMRGNRCTKRRAAGMDAFDSPNYGPLASVEIEVKVHWEDLFYNDAENLPFQYFNRLEKNVIYLPLTPGMSPDLLAKFLEPPVKGVVLGSFGVGNAPEQDPRFMAVIAAACERGLVIVNTSQCYESYVMPAAYAAGVALSEAGVIAGRDITKEAAVAKLSFCLAFCDGDVESVRQLMQTDLRGEIALRGPSRFAYQDTVLCTIAETLPKGMQANVIPSIMCAAAAKPIGNNLLELVRQFPEYINKYNYDRRTPLHVAAAAGVEENCAVLLEHGAIESLSQKDKFGLTPRQDALRHSHLPCAHLLQLYEESLKEAEAHTGSEVEPDTDRSSVLR